MAEQPSEPPAQVIAEARNVPGGWVYEIDGEFGPDEAVPPEAIRGAWEVLPDGTPSGKFQPNPRFVGPDR